MVITEEQRERALNNISYLKARPDYIELYMYLLYADNCFLTEDLVVDGKPSPSKINKKTRELVLLLGRHLILTEEGDTHEN